jgi:RNA polymerase sigma-70 factor (ECF subfamily)
MLRGCALRSTRLALRASASCYACAVMEEASDEELVQCIGDADPRREAAEAVLCRRFAPRIRLYGLKHLRDADRARDLTQTVLVALLRAARERRIDDPERVHRFVFGTCRNTVARMRKQELRVPLATDEAVAALASVPPPTIELNALFACLAKLEQRASQVVMMSFLEGRTADEIALALAARPGNIRVIRHRAVGFLRQCLDGEGGTV